MTIASITKEELETQVSIMRYSAISQEGTWPRLDWEYNHAVETGDWATFEASLIQMGHAELTAFKLGQATKTTLPPSIYPKLDRNADIDFSDGAEIERWAQQHDEGYM